MTITKRLTKGSPLTNAELDENFNDLDTARVMLAVTYTGTGRALGAADNGKVLPCSNAGAIAMVYSAHLDRGCVLRRAGAGEITLTQSGGMTLTPASTTTAGLNSRIVIEPTSTTTADVHLVGAVGVSQADVDTSITEALDGLSSAPVVTISGTRGNGNTLTAAVDSRWGGLARQWQSLVSSTWTDIAGATGLTHVDGSVTTDNITRQIRFRLGTADFYATSNVLAAGTYTPSSAVIDDFNRANGAPANGWDSPRAGAQIIDGRLYGGASDAIIDRAPSVSYDRTVKATVFYNAPGGEHYPAIKILSGPTTSYDDVGAFVFFNPDGSMNFGGRNIDNIWNNHSGGGSAPGAFPMTTEFEFAAEIRMVIEEGPNRWWYGVVLKVNGTAVYTSAAYLNSIPQYNNNLDTTVPADVMRAGLWPAPAATGSYFDNFDVVALA